jgi:hypothetical protein
MNLRLKLALPAIEDNSCEHFALLSGTSTAEYFHVALSTFSRVEERNHSNLLSALPDLLQTLKAILSNLIPIADLKSYRNTVNTFQTPLASSYLYIAKFNRNSDNSVACPCFPFREYHFPHLSCRENPHICRFLLLFNHSFHRRQ